MNNTKIKAIADSAVGAALCTLLIMISLYVPILAAFAAIVCGLPVMLLFYKHNITSGILAFFCAFLLSFILTGNIVSVGVAMLTYAAPAAVFGLFNSKGHKFSTSVIAAAAVTLVGVVIEFGMLNGSGTGIRDSIAAYSSQVQNLFNEAVSSSGIEVGSDMSAAVAQAFEQVIDGIMYYLPTFIICIAVFYAYAISMIGVFVMKRLRVKNIEYVRFNKLVAPKFVCHITVLLFVVTLIAKDNGVYTAALKNVLLVSEIALGVCGFAFLDLKFSGVLKQWYIRLVIYIGAWFSVFMMIPVLADVLVLIGFFRSLYLNPLGNGSGGKNHEG